MNVSYAPVIEAAARAHHLDPRLLAAVAAQETGGPGSDSGRNIVGDGGHGRGLFQIDDRWHDFARTPQAMDPAANAQYAAGMISGLLKRYGGNVHAALSAYNAGDPRATGTKTTWDDGKTLGYADSVLRHYARLCGAPSAPASCSDESPAELARADAPSLLSFADPLLAALPQIHPPHRSHHSGLDATGHSLNDLTSKETTSWDF